MTLREVRALFARLLLKNGEFGRAQRLGSIVLRPHQISAVARLRDAIAEFGGALLSDQVGMGKTFAALAIARERSSATVVAPAVLKEMWQSAAESAKTSIAFMSMESLSRQSEREVDALAAGTLLIVDEAHHFRNSATLRFRALSRIAARSDMLLMSATPVHNRARDLVSLLSLFMGSRAADLSPSELGRVVIRRDRGQLANGLPEIEPPRWCELEHDDEIPELLLALPPPLPPQGGGDGGALVVHSLIRQWVSSDAALHRALVRRLQRATALTQALESGTYPSRSELSAWVSADDCVQLAFAELVSSPVSAAQELLPAVRRHAEAVEAAIRRLKGSSTRDNERACITRALRKAHRDSPIVAFSQYADTIDGLFNILSRDGGVAALTGNGARVFGGRITRSDAIGRFAPLASGRPRAARCDEVTLLLTTDLLSEGVNLQDAGVVVHLDLPWTPAKLEQRLGRVARLGSKHDRVFSYIMKPPASADTLIRLERILRDKMKAAGIVADDLESLLPRAPTPEKRDPSNASAVEGIRSILESWASVSASTDAGQMTACSVDAGVNGFLALCITANGHALLACDEQGVTEDPLRVLSVMKLCDGAELETSSENVASAVESIDRYFASSRMLASPNAHASPLASHRRGALRRIARIASEARPHDRSRIAALAARARSSLVGRLTAADERCLATLSTARITNEQWLAALCELGVNSIPTTKTNEIVALILLQNTRDKKA